MGPAYFCYELPAKTKEALYLVGRREYQFITWHAKYTIKEWIEFLVKRSLYSDEVKEELFCFIFEHKKSL